MKNFVTMAAFAAGANALVSRGNTCCFHLKASGGASGTLGQLDDGQNRIGDGSLSPAQYCIDASGSITDANGRGCILTSPTTQFQCDEGASPTPGFSINSEGLLEYSGSTDFVACETGQNGGLNIYTTNSTSVTGCRDVTLSADSCQGSAASSSAAASSATPVPTSAPVASSPAQSSTAVVSSVPVPESNGPKPSVFKTLTTTTTYCPTESGSAPTPGTSGPASSAPVPESTAPVPQPSVPASESTAPAESQPAPQPSVPASESTAPAESQPAPVPESTAPAAQPTVPASESTAPAESQPAPSQTASASQSSGTQSAGSGCPTDLSGEYQYPHLIIPVDSSKPDTAPGTSYNGTVSDTITTLFNFDIPFDYSGKTCSLVFLFPELEDLETSSYSFSGDGKINFASLESPVSSSTTCNNAPSVKQDYGEYTISRGNSYRIATFSCPAGQAVGYEMKNAGSTHLEFFQDWNPSPLGLYITVC